MTTTHAPLPSAMPRKTNPLHTQILSSLLKPLTTTRKEFRPKKDGKVSVIGGDGERHVIDAYKNVVVDVPVPTLAGNVSSENVERIAQRWLR